MYVKIKQGGTNYDVAIPSDYMIEKMVKENLVEPIDLKKITTLGDIADEFKDLPFDKGNQYSVPYMWGTVGIIYNKTVVTEPVDSWDVLWDENHKGEIIMLDSQRDAIAVSLKRLGYSLNTRDTKELEAAKKALIEQKPLLLAYAGDNLKDMMISGEGALAVCWSGDAMYMMSENPDLAYALPKEGSNLWFDNMVIPKGAKNVEEAHLFIDFMNRAEIAKKNVEYIGYSTPNTKTKGLLDPSVSGNPSAYPNMDQLNNFEVFLDPGTFIEEYNRIWTEVKSAK
jgi:spermidine/putrescine transport system substrate-binding protein